MSCGRVYVSPLRIIGSRISQIASRSLSVAGWMAKQASLLKSDEFFKFGFGEDGYTEFFGFVVFGARVRADDDVVGFFADGAAELVAVLLDKFAGFFAAAVFEGAGEDEGFPGEFLALDFAFLGGLADSPRLPLFYQPAGVRVPQEIDHCFAVLLGFLRRLFPN